MRTSGRSGLGASSLAAVGTSSSATGQGATSAAGEEAAWGRGYFGSRGVEEEVARQGGALHRTGEVLRGGIALGRDERS